VLAVLFVLFRLQPATLGLTLSTNAALVDSAFKLHLLKADWDLQNALLRACLIPTAMGVLANAEINKTGGL